MSFEENENKLKEAFLQLLRVPSDQRAGWIETECPEHLRKRLQELLKFYAKEEGEGDLENPFWKLSETRIEAESELPEKIGDYRIISELGFGGMATVYLAEDVTLERVVALKVLHEHIAISEVSVARFRQEAITVAQLEHPAIVPIYQVGNNDGKHYLSIQYIDGKTLEKAIKEKKKKNTLEWVSTQAKHISRIADALDYSHQNSVIHRDIKPSNILINQNGEAFLTDYGIARNLRLDRVTKTGLLAGSAMYMSPEQASSSGEKIDHRTDIFSLGVTLYESLTGKPPFTGSSAEQIRQSILRKPPPKLHSLNNAVSPDLEVITYKALEKEPRHRYQTAAHFAADLRCYLDGRPILAKPPGLIRLLREWIRAHKSACATFVFVLLVTVITSLYLINRSVRRSLMTSVLISCDKIGVEIYVSEFNRKNGRFGEAISVGYSPIDNPILNSGLYKAIAHESSSKFSESIFFVPTKRKVSNDHSEENPIKVNLRLNINSNLVNMVKIGSQNSMTKHEPEAFIEEFWIDRYEVSNEEYLAFVIATNRERPYHWSGQEGLYYDDEYALHPVVGITQDDARSYAEWRGKRLPTQDEWEYAMSYFGNQNLGNGNVKPALNITAEDIRQAQSADWVAGLEMYRKYVQPVKSAPKSMTKSEIINGNSNVREITASIDFEGGEHCVQRGRCWSDSPDQPLSKSSVFMYNTSSLRRGFRCIRSVTAKIH